MEYSKLGDILGCPICLEIATSPIYQCPKGHIICKICIGKIKDRVCPTCRVILPQNEPIRSIPAEQLLGSLDVKCQNQSAGCQVVVKAVSISQHLLNCEYRKDQWCNKIYPGFCAESYALVNFVSHCRTHHSPLYKTIENNMECMLAGSNEDHLPSIKPTPSSQISQQGIKPIKCLPLNILTIQTFKPTQIQRLPSASWEGPPPSKTPPPPKTNAKMAPYPTFLEDKFGNFYILTAVISEGSKSITYELLLRPKTANYLQLSPKLSFSVFTTTSNLKWEFTSLNFENRKEGLPTFVSLKTFDVSVKSVLNAEDYNVGELRWHVWIKFPCPQIMELAKSSSTTSKTPSKTTTRVSGNTVSPAAGNSALEEDKKCPILGVEDMFPRTPAAKKRKR